MEFLKIFLAIILILISAFCLMSEIIVLVILAIPLCILALALLDFNPNSSRFWIFWDF
jgi:hypothetical protein